MTVHEVEQIREKTGLDLYGFSRELGYSHATYYLARKRGRLSRGFRAAVELRFRKFLRDVKAEHPGEARR